MLLSLVIDVGAAALPNDVLVYHQTFAGRRIDQATQTKIEAICFIFEHEVSVSGIGVRAVVQ
jgi:hypothetical protein